MAKQKKPEPGAEAASLPFDKYEIAEMNRRDLKDAPYNPRIMSDDALDKLRKGIKRLGMLQPPIWNKRTARIVGGHQRLKALDILHGSPDYTLKVAVVDLDEAAEKEANLLLNNPNAMGDWDLPKLEELLRDTSIELVGTGFDMADVYRLLGDAPGRSAEEIDTLADSLRKARENYEQVVNTSRGRDNNDFYLVVVFRDSEHRDAFTGALKLDENRYQDGRKLMELLRQGQDVKTDSPDSGQSTPATQTPG